MSEFNFNSQICTDKNQSERLLALGLKIETADCYHWQETDIYGDGNGKWHCGILFEYNKDHNEYLYNVYGVDGSDEGFFIPAWSLHRLLSLIPREFEVNVIPMCGRNYEMPIEMHILPDFSVVYSDLSKETYKGFYYTNIYDSLISCIEWQVEQGYFPKEYLV